MVISGARPRDAKMAAWTTRAAAVAATAVDSNLVGSEIQKCNILLGSFYLFFITTRGSLAQRGFFLYLTFFLHRGNVRQGGKRINFVAKILVVFCGGFGW